MFRLLASHYRSV